MSLRVTNLNLSLQQATLGDFAPTGNVSIAAGKALSVGGTTVFDTNGLMDWTLLKNTPFLFNPLTLPVLPAT